MSMKLSTAEPAAKVKRPPGRPRKVLEGATAAPANPIAPIETPDEVPPWVTALIAKWNVLDAKIEKLLAAVEIPDTALTRALVESPTTAAAPAPAVAPKERAAPLPKPEAMALEEAGYRSVTATEIEAMDFEGLVELARDLDVDIANCFKPDGQPRPSFERIVRQRILVFVGKAGDIYEADKRKKA